MVQVNGLEKRNCSCEGHVPLRDREGKELRRRGEQGKVKDGVQREKKESAKRSGKDYFCR